MTNNLLSLTASSISRWLSGHWNDLGKRLMSNEREREREWNDCDTLKKRLKGGDEWLTWLWWCNCVRQDIRSYHSRTCLIGSWPANMSSTADFLPFRSATSLSFSLSLFFPLSLSFSLSLFLSLSLSHYLSPALTPSFFLSFCVYFVLHPAWKSNVLTRTQRCKGWWHFVKGH